MERILIAPHPQVLGTFALVVTTIVSLAHCVTSERIAINQTQQLIRQLSQVLPEKSFDNLLHDESINIFDPVNQQERTVYLAKLNGNTKAVVITANAANGYVSDISLLVGIYKNSTISSVRVLQHRETPGLGDKIEHRKSDWITQFDGVSISYPQNWAVKKDGGEFDQLTGATVTPRAVVQAVRATLDFFEQNKHRFFTDS